MVDLLGDGAKEPKAKKVKVPTDGAGARLIALFHDEYVRRWSPPDIVAAWEADRSAVSVEELVKPRVVGGKHGRKFKELSEAWGESVVATLVKQFFKSTDPQVTRRDYGYDAFFATVDHLYLSVRGRRQRLDPQTAANVDAAARAAGRK